MASYSWFLQFYIEYKSGRSNCDADGRSKSPQDKVKLFPNIVKAICEAYAIQRGSCPCAETLVVTSASYLYLQVLFSWQNMSILIYNRLILIYRGKQILQIAVL